MVDYHEKIDEIQAAMSKARYNKSTEKWFALMKSEIAKLRGKIESQASKKQGGKGFFVKKSGDATVIIVGFPSVGKSTLLNALTGSKSKTASYEFTTLDVVPGMLKFKFAKIQLLDVPGIISGAAYGRGRGKEVLAMARNADLVLFVVDCTHPEHLPILEREVYDVGIRINERRPEVKIVKKERDGINMSSTVPLTKSSVESLHEVLRSFKFMNVDVVIRDDISVDQFIDSIEANKKYMPAIVALSKVDLVSADVAADLKKKLNACALVSAHTGAGLEDLKSSIYDSLKFIRIYLKEVNKQPDMNVPLVLKAPVSIKSVCEHIHRDFVRKFRYARVWGKSAKFDGQQFRNIDKVLSDSDILEITVR